MATTLRNLIDDWRRDAENKGLLDTEVTLNTITDHLMISTPERKRLYLVMTDIGEEIEARVFLKER